MPEASCRDIVKQFLRNCSPMGDKYIILPEQEDDDSGFVLPETKSGEERPQIGEIVGKGPGRTSDNGALMPMQFDLGERVVFKKYAGDEIFYDQKLVMYPAHTEMRDDLVFVRIVNQESILFSFPVA